jgi:nucleoside phosphorylase
VVPFLDPDFFLSYFQNPPPAATTYIAEDMETAAVARVAAQHRTPFIAFRAVSDGKGDPLMLPGFPFQFFMYRQLAADNAATVALAFLKAWAAR